MRRHLLAAAVMVAGSAAFSWFAAGTRPFTSGADAYCAVAIAVVGAATLAPRYLAKARPHALQPPTSSPGAAGPAPAAGAGGSLRPWVLTIVALVVFEVIAYVAGFGGRRHEFPTVSSMYDTAARFHAVKAFVFLLWLALGWRLLRR